MGMRAAKKSESVDRSPAADEPAADRDVFTGELAAFYEDHAVFLAGKLRLHRVPAGDAGDVLHDFIVRVVVGRGLLERLAGLATADGRALLAKALGDHLTDLRRANGKRSRRERRHWLDLHHRKRRGRASGYAIDRKLATQAMQEALRRTRRELRRKGMDHRWRAFELRTLLPAIQGGPRPGLTMVAARLGYDSERQLSGALSFVRQRIRQLMREYIESRAAVDWTDSELKRAIEAVFDGLE